MSLTQEQLDAINRQHRTVKVKQTLQELQLEELAAQLNVTLPRSLEELKKFITEDPAMKEMKRTVEELCVYDDPVLIHGETGVGKEIIASALHGHRAGPFLSVNTTSLPDTLLESELFGHKKGSFTGALEDRVGKFEAAQHGTIFLDEIGDMKPNMQEKLLRVLQEKVITRVGENHERRINCRVVAATHKVIRRETANTVEWLPGFREDLYWRLATFEVHISPLRERPGDIHEILDAKLDPTGQLSPEFRESLATMPLTGNVRELQARVKREFLRMRLANHATVA